jgi:hypothetical protein
MPPAIAAATVNPSQMPAITWNPIMAFTATSVPRSSYAARGVLAAAGTKYNATPRGVLRFCNMTEPPQRTDLRRQMRIHRKAD